MTTTGKRLKALSEAKLMRAGDVRVGDVVELARGSAKVTGIAFRGEGRIELQYDDSHRYGVYNVETELHVKADGKR